ncbi:uncharacterized protein LOC126739640 [Anthonomus grandis grandis]|uniref:uncharacterized protein LOC126739640 n=1 Tax=Anthonomus grandis grandis TaxID=2921223 RepID=UPI002165E0DB|nr:uncharacterized protein LOC126739640 [Anthonomus grandis grandis]
MRCFGKKWRLKKMVVSKSGDTVRPCIKEVIFVTSRLPSTLPRTKAARISELPSLRYGPIGARTIMTGPLKIPKQFGHKYHDIRSGSLERGRGGRQDRRQATRKVRFTLPPADDTTYTISSETPTVENFDSFPLHRRVSARGAAVNIENDSNFNSDGSRRPASIREIGVKSSASSSIRGRKVHDDAASLPGGGKELTLTRRFEEFRKERLQDTRRKFGERVEVPVSVSPGVRYRVHPTARYVRGTLSPTSNQAPHESPLSPGGQALLKAARDGDDHALRDQLRRALALGICDADLNAVDSSGRTVLSYVASNGTIDLLELMLQLPGLDPNKCDNEGNTPLHFAAQAGQVECLNCLASRCRGVDIDARNNLGFTPLMKAALQGRNKCAKLLLFAGANPTLRDNGRGFRADQWARFCGRYVCADVIEKHARQRLLERSTSYGSWGLEHEMGNRVVVAGKVVPIPPVNTPPCNGFKSKLKKVFRTSSGPSSDTFSSARLVTQLTSAALCASSPVLPSSGAVSPMVKSLLRPLTVPRLQITLVNNNGDYPNHNLEPSEENFTQDDKVGDKVLASNGAVANGKNEPVKPSRSRKKK